ncbi:MAG TPA: type II toxin-antitoxin system RelE/ParE family toxin [Desulfomonilaceae bacterium]|nr:type II toxin-antitoxin system RelE/ParE family toxin [Desulfomonilaceae bacterium]
MSYRILIFPKAQRQIRRLPGGARSKVLAAIDSLAENPRPAGVKKLTATENHFRIRVGDYRIIYAIEDDFLVIFVIAAGHRKDIYRRLKALTAKYTPQYLLAMIEKDEEDT